MNTQALSRFAKDVQLTLSKHSPQILMGLGIAGMITSTVLAVRATPKAIKLIDEKKEELDTETLTPVETVKTTWKCYVPAAITGVVSVGCLISSNSVSTRRYAALATAYKISETAYAEYREKTVEAVGEKKERSIRDKVSAQQIQDNPRVANEVIVTGKGKTLCFDPLSSRYFYSDLEKIKRAENKLNKEIICDPFEMGVSVNDFYDAIGLPHTMTGDNLGWKRADYLIDIYPSAQMAEEGSDFEGEPCIVLNHSNPPKYDLL